MKVMNDVKRASTGVDLALLLVRIALGVVFVMHGWQKVTTIGHAGFAGMLASMGVPFAPAFAAIVLAVEIGGGLAMLAGLLARPAGLLLAVNILVAGSLVHLKNGFFLPTGFEFTFVLMLISLAITAAGAGAYSLDARLFGPAPQAPDVREKVAA
ncbi:MAG TPA: DoxX family protein [Vicinamibacterales bacterium]